MDPSAFTPWFAVSRKAPADGLAADPAPDLPAASSVVRSVEDKGEVNPERLAPLTVVFTDIVGSTRFFKTFGDKLGRRLLAQHERLVGREVSAEGGKVLKTIGDAVMACFENPDAALRAALRVQQRLLRVNRRRGKSRQMRLRIGIHHGQGLVETNDIFGNVVNLAAKIVSLAAPGEILVSQALLDSLARQPDGLQPVSLSGDSVELAGLALYRVPYEQSQGEEPAPQWLLHCQGQSPEWDAPRIAQLLAQRRSGAPTAIPSKPQRAGSCLLAFGDADAALAAAVALLDAGRSAQLAAPRLVLDRGLVPPAGAASTEGERDPWRALPSGTVLVTAAAYAHLKADSNQFAPLRIDAVAEPFYQLATPSAEQGRAAATNLHEAGKPSPATSRSGGKEAHPAPETQFPPCFHCGQSWHAAWDCPSHAMLDAPFAAQRLGHRPVQQIERLAAETRPRSLFRSLLRDSQEAGSWSQSELMAMALLDLHFAWQLRALRAVWGAAPRCSWDGVRRVEGLQVDGGPLWLALECLRSGDRDGARKRLAAWGAAEEFRLLSLQGLLQIEEGDERAAEATLQKALKLAQNPNQRVLMLLWLVRLGERAGGDPLIAKGHLRAALACADQCPEALYRQMNHKFRSGNLGGGLAELTKLVENDPEFFVWALIDPELAPVREPIRRHLQQRLGQIREAGLQALPVAVAAVKRLALLWGEKLPDLADLTATLERARALEKEDSFLGWLEMGRTCQAIVHAASRIVAEGQRRVFERLYELGAGCQHLFLLSAPYAQRPSIQLQYNRLGLLQKEIESLKRGMRGDKPGMFTQIDGQIHALQNRLDKVALRMHLLHNLIAAQAYLAVLARRLILFESINLAAALLVIPLLAHYAAFLAPGMALARGTLWHYQKVAMMVGGGVAAVLAVIESLKADRTAKTTTLTSS